jgi:uncharacterized membrane protein YqaE (UPF0057 family)
MMLLSFALLAAPAQAAFVTKAAVETTTTTSEVALKNAVTESWSSLSRSERKSRVREAKDAIRNFSKAEGSDNQLLLIIVAILLPPLAVLLHEGRANSRFLLSILLWLLFYIPGLIYALYVILS